jgi:tetratricopeptide (TPR) repeat protein
MEGGGQPGFERSALVGGEMQMRIARRQRRNTTPAYGPAVMDRQRAADTLAEAEHALRVGDARRAEETYLRALGKLGPFADPAWRSGAATDARVRAQCHARLAAIAFDDEDYERSLRETSMAAASRHQAIELDRCTSDDIRFMITALVHSATVHDRLGSHREALESSMVALEFGRFARTQDHDPATRRSIAAAQRAAARLYEELNERNPLTAAADPDRHGDLDRHGDADQNSQSSSAADGSRPVAADGVEGPVIDLTDTTARRQLLATASIDVLGIPDEPIRSEARTADAGQPDRSFADLIDLTETDPRPQSSGSSPAMPDDPTTDPVAASAPDPTPDPVAASAPDPTTDPGPTGLDLAGIDPTSFAPLGLLQAQAAPADAQPPTEPDLLDAVASAARGASAPHPPARSDQPDDRADEVPIDGRFARPQRQAPQRADRLDPDPVAAGPGLAAPDVAGPDHPTHHEHHHHAEQRRPVDIDLTRPAVAPVERRQTPSPSGESAAELIGRSRNQALLARVLLGQSDSEAAINAHRAVRTATRARQWAKEDPDATPVVALNLIEVLVIRGDVLASAGHDEVARTDLRRARAIAEQLWQACPSPTSAIALAVVALRSAVLDLAAGSGPQGSCHLDQARQVIAQARALDLALPPEMTRAGDALDGIGAVDPGDEAQRLEVVELGDRLLDRLQALDQEPDALEAPVPVS